MKPQMDATQRFTDRVDYYVHYRPSYSDEMLAFLIEEIQLTSQSIVADIGSGTGFLARPFLEIGCQVFGVEPNAAMRMAGESFLTQYTRFASVAASAERTTLKSNSVDFITVGSAFHWFDPIPTKVEFGRILKPGGWVVIVGNSRAKDAGCPARELDEILERFAIDESSQIHTQEARVQRIDNFFGGGRHRMQSFNHSVMYNLEGLEGYVLSHSSAPLKYHSNHDVMKKVLATFFDKYQRSGQVELSFVTQLFYGQP